MAMEITNNYGNYAGSYTANYAGAAGKTQAAEKDNAAGAASEKKVSAREKTADYYNYLQKNFDCVREGKVAIDGSYLKECANNPEKAKQLEEDLAFFKESVKDGRRNAEANARAHGDTLISYEETWSYDSKGNLTMIAMASCTTDPGTKDSKELAKEQQERLKEKKEKTRAEEKMKEKKEEQQKTLEKLQESLKEQKTEIQGSGKVDNLYYGGIDISV